MWVRPICIFICVFIFIRFRSGLLFCICISFIPRSQSATVKPFTHQNDFTLLEHDVYHFYACAKTLLHFRFSKDNWISAPAPGSALNDGQWHAIRLVAKENFAMLTIDGEEASAVRSTSPLTITTGGTYHLGGKGHHNAHQHRSDNNTTPKVPFHPSLYSSPEPNREISYI